jgi:hypothetical protein
MNEVCRITKNDVSFFEITDDEKNVLIKLAAECGVPKEKIRTWILEYNRSTFSEPASPLYLEKILPISK